MSYAHVLDWAATLAMVVLCAFFVGVGGVRAWHDRRGPAHRLPLLALAGAMGLLVAASAASWLFVRPYHVGSAWWAQGTAYVVVLASGIVLWHGFGTCLRGLAPRRPGLSLAGGLSLSVGDEKGASSGRTLGE